MKDDARNNLKVKVLQREPDRTFVIVCHLLTAGNTSPTERTRESVQSRKAAGVREEDGKRFGLCGQDGGEWRHAVLLEQQQKPSLNTDGDGRQGDGHRNAVKPLANIKSEV